MLSIRAAAVLVCFLAVLTASDVVAQTQSPFAPPPAPAVPEKYQAPNSNSQIPYQQPAAFNQQPPAANIQSEIQNPKSKIPQPPATNHQPPTTTAKPLEGGQIIARVDGQVVLASDVLWQVNLLLQQNRDRIPPGKEDEAREMLLQQQVMGLLDTKMLYADFIRTVPPENLPRVTESLAEPFEQNEVPRLMKVLDASNAAELSEKLQANGSSMEAVRQQFIERTIAGEWLRQRIPQPKPVTHQQMLEYYQQHLADYEYPAQARWEELMVRLDRFGGDRSAAWRAICEMGNRLWKQVASQPDVRGPVFAEIAKSSSHGFTANKGGLQDWTTRDALRCQALNDAIFSLQVGQLSNIIESDQGFHIIRVLERKEAGRKPFTEAQAEIREKLIADQRKGLFQAELVKIRKGSRVWTAFTGDLGAEQLASPKAGNSNRR